MNQANDIWRLVTVEHLKKAMEGLVLLREQVTLELEARKLPAKPTGDRGRKGGVSRSK